MFRPGLASSRRSLARLVLIGALGAVSVVGCGAPAGHVAVKPERVEKLNNFYVIVGTATDFAEATDDERIEKLIEPANLSKYRAYEQFGCEVGDKKTTWTSLYHTPATMRSGPVAVELKDKGESVVVTIKGKSFTEDQNLVVALITDDVSNGHWVLRKVTTADLRAAKDKKLEFTVRDGRFE